MNIIFAGTPTISAFVLEQLILNNIDISACYTRPDRPQGRGQKSIFSPVKIASISHNIPVLQPETLKDPNAIAMLQQLQPDLIIVFAYGLILPQAVLSIPKSGCINIHTSLLPRWRGAAPTQHAILAGDYTTGISIIQMDAGLDTGVVLESISCEIADTDTNGSLLNKLQQLAVTAILKVLDQLKTNQLQPKIQDNTLSTYAHKIDKHQAKINWNLSAKSIDRLIRAFIPEPVAYTQLQPQDHIKIWQASVKLHHSELSPGKIIKINKHNLEVATGDGILQIESMQFPGGKIQPVASLLNSSKYKQLFEKIDYFM